jgi:hypothetical protein
MGGRDIISFAGVAKLQISPGSAVFTAAQFAHYEAIGDLGLSSPCADSRSDSKDRAVWAATSGGKEGRRRPWFRAKTRSSMTTQAPKSMPSTSRGLSWEVF